ncbi:MAG: carboxypeptidase regulatory-like domain-containing protein [Gemmatimonadales bacterium]
MTNHWWTRTLLRMLVGVCLALLAAPAGPLQAQSGAGTDLITGTITTEQGVPLADALVEAVSVETQVMRSARTNARGRYTIVFPDGGGQYRLTVRAIGAAPVQRLISRQADEDRLVVNIQMSATPVVLEELRVQGRRAPARLDQPPTPGSTERVLTGEQTQRLPLDAGDLLALATLAPGVVAVTGNDSTPGGISVAGQRPTANNVTLDGLTFAGASVPQDAIRSTRVITSSYDVSRGQFSGGLVSTTTRSGTNNVQGSVNYGLRDQDLALESGDDAFAAGFNQHQLSFGLGGPIKRDKLFIFGSGQGRFRTDDLQSLLSATPATLSRLGIAPDSATRLVGVLGDLGVPVDRSVAFANRDATDLSGLLRLDYAISQAHTLTARADYRRNVQEPSRVGALSVPATDSRSSTRGGGVMLTANSRFGTNVVNELRAYRSTSSATTPLDDPFPSGRVQVVSALDDQRGANTVSFGGIAGLPQATSSRSFEASNEISWIPGGGPHRFKLGAFYTVTTTESDVTVNRFGTFTFSSIADLEAGLPSSFTRALAPTIRATGQTTFAAHLGDIWRVTDRLQLTLGARLERSSHDGEPGLNPAVQSAFGLRTDRWPTEWHLSPRLGFSWFVRSADGGPAALVIRGGIGEFRSPAPGALFSAAQAATGLTGSESQLTCVGPGAPQPDWAGYRADPSTIPTACAGPAPGPGALARAPTVAVFDPAFQAPRAWRMSLGAQRRSGLIVLGAELSHARGTSQFGVRDVNLGAARFALGDDKRPVFVPAPVIDPRTGALPLFASRRVAELGNVLAFDSRLASRSTQLTLSANGATNRGAFLNLSYTWSRSRDQSSFAAGGAQRGFTGQTTAGDPNVREWATSDFERRHALLATVTYPLTRNLELTTITRLTTGAAYTPMVSDDINGDGARNDRAFIFGATPDTAVAAAMSRLLTTTSGGARDCLEAQRGRIAGRNSCRGPWQPSVDFQLNFRPTWLGLDRRLTASLVTSNFLVGLDRVLHGADGLKGWGQPIRPEGTLLVVRGFDPVTSQFRYAVNERFGASTANTVAFRQPFQIGIQLRYTIGPDLFAQFRDGLRAGGRGAAGAGRGAGGPLAGGRGPADMITRMTSLMPDPGAEIIAIRVALRLSDDQVTRLQVISDTLKAATKALADRAQREIERAGPNPDPASLFGSMRPLLQSIRTVNADALKAAEAVLTPEQWGQVPERIRSPRPLGGPGQAGRPPS